jgi:hypothetical protein
LGPESEKSEKRLKKGPFLGVFAREGPREGVFYWLSSKICRRGGSEIHTTTPYFCSWAFPRNEKTVFDFLLETPQLGTFSLFFVKIRRFDPFEASRAIDNKKSPSRFQTKRRIAYYVFPPREVEPPQTVR